MGALQSTITKMLRALSANGLSKRVPVLSISELSRLGKRNVDVLVLRPQLYQTLH